MNRRNFFRSMVGGVAAAAAVRTWPFRVFSFPSVIASSGVNLEQQAGWISYNYIRPAIAKICADMDAEIERWNNQRLLIPLKVTNGIDWEMDFSTGIVTVRP